MSFADLAVDTAVRPDDAVPGRYHVTLPDHWDYLAPSGGVVMTCALRAAVAAIGDPELRFASATAIFATPIHTGALVCDVHPIRRGRATAQVRVELRHASAEEHGVELIGTFVRDRKGPDVRGVAFPRVRSLADARDAIDDAPSNPHARFRFYQQLECKIADGEPFWASSFEAGPARYARWFRYRNPQRDAAGHLDRLALPPIIDTMPTALHRAIGPGAYRFFAPSLDLTVYTVDDTSREWLLVAATVRRARAGWAIGDLEVWDDEGRFIAYGAQAMYLHGVAGDPPVVDASKRT
jgi:acyl-CoA thioesterase